MRKIFLVSLAAALPALCQQPASQTDRVPIYRVMVTERTVQAVNYQYRTGPTKIDFRGTVLLPAAKGSATVESRRGRTEIDAKLIGLTPPTSFGREYLAYVLWAITPEGAPHNIGEIVPDGSDKAALRVTTDLNAFGLIVTAEPYAAARKPSEVVVLENIVRPDTVGKVQDIQAKYELMPRGHYTYDVPNALSTAVSNAPKVSMQQYEALLELYEAQNAVGIARAADAARYAPDTFARAEQLLADAQRLQSTGAGSAFVVQRARAAAQMAEDARAITEKRAQDEKLAQAQAEAQRAKAEADAARAQAQAERAARERAEEDAAAARQAAQQNRNH